MDPDKANYYRLCELCDVTIPKHLSAFLEKKMKEKEDGYAHTNAWWENNQDKLSRAPPEGTELIAFMGEEPENWGTNLFIKVLKYSNYELLERYEKEWTALDALIETRKDVASRGPMKKIAPGDAENYFQKVLGAFGKLKLVGAMQEVQALKKKAPSADEGNTFHKNLGEQDTEWKTFDAKLYERYGKPQLDQIEKFHTKRGDTVNIVVQMATQYNSFGPKMLKDRSGAQVQALWRANIGDPVETTKAILRTWLGGTGEPTTWDQLVQCLRHSDLNVVARDVDETLI